MSYTTDVLVVGAGPTGLLLAGDLAAAGVRTTVLERRTDESNLTRAFAVHARTLELLDARGIADELAGTGRKLDGLRLFGNIAVDVSDLPTRFPYVLITPQYETERVLEQRAVSHGADIVTGAEVVGLRQDADGVEVRVRSADGAEATWRAAYVVGADGVRSTVRQALGLPFPGRSAVRSVMLADVRLTEPPRDVLTANGVRDGFAFLAPFGDGWYRVIAWNRYRQLPDDAPVTLEEVRTITAKALGSDFGMHDPRWLSRFHSDERQVPRYRVGRVFLAGDAAHVHSPAGGQGMNIGLHDAANLSWKLAAAVRGWAPDGLLDTYHDERHPVGRMVVRGSGALLRLALLGSPVLRSVRNAVLRAATRSPAVARRIGRTVSGIGIRYPAPRGADPLVGQRAPDLALAGDGPTRLYEALRGGQFVLVTRDQPPEGVADRLVVVRPADSATPTMLVRPDGYVAWAAERTDPASRDAAVHQWLGVRAEAESPRGNTPSR